MANPTTGFGLRPVRHLDGSPYNGAVVKCYISASYATALYVGDAVTLTETAANVDSTARYFSIEASDGADGSEILGVITSIVTDTDNLGRHYSPASTEGYCYVCIDPTVIYQIRDDGGTALTSTTSVGLNAIIDVTGSGSTVTGLSGMTLDTNTTPSVNASNPLFILGLADMEGNELATSAIWEVLIGNHVLSSSGGGTDGRILGLIADG